MLNSISYTGVLIRKHKKQTQRGRDWSFATTRQGMPAAAGSWKRQGTDSSPRAFIKDSDPTNLGFELLASRTERINMLFSATQFVVLCYNGPRKRIQ